MKRLLLSLLSFAALAACAAELTSPQPRLEGIPAGLDVQFTVAPAEVAPRDPFTVRLAVTNPTTSPVRIVTANGCLALPNVLRDGRRVPFRGSALGCTAAVTTHVFAPGQTRTLTWELRAELYAENPGDVDGAPAPRGTYRVQAEFDPFVQAPAGEKAFAETLLQVR